MIKAAIAAVVLGVVLPLLSGCGVTAEQEPEPLTTSPAPPRHPQDDQRELPLRGYPTTPQTPVTAAPATIRILPPTPTPTVRE
jgi:hypothetical protein